MIFSSVLSLDDVMKGFETMNYNFEEITVYGIQMQVELVEPGRARIVRLLSLNPQDYLNPNFAPGQIVEYVRSNKV